MEKKCIFEVPLNPMVMGFFALQTYTKEMCSDQLQTAVTAYGKHYVRGADANTELKTTESTGALGQASG